MNTDFTTWILKVEIFFAGILTVEIFFAAYMLLFSYFFARYGVEHFNKVFASIILATGINCAIVLKFTGLDALWGGDIFSLNGYAEIYWGSFLLISTCFFFWGRFLSYVAIFGLITIALIIPFRLLGIEANPALTIGSVIASLLITIFTRRHSIKVLVGATSGLYFSVLPSYLISLALSKSLTTALAELNYENVTLATKAYVAITFAMPLIFAGIGIAIQYLWHEKLFGSLESENKQN